ncbi:MAG: hypothetical protein IJI66_03410 [Erysipelotrichaceae bacterium]|nr:hypothetical protein [Erysipelotrichaceae bacterium]
MYDSIKYDTYLKASIEKLEVFKRSLKDDDIRISIIDKELYKGYYDVFVKPEHRILTSFLAADYKLIDSGTVFYHKQVPALPLDNETDIDKANFIAFKTELPQPLNELDSAYLSSLENKFNEDPYVLNKMLDSYNEMYQGRIVFYKFYECIPYENIIQMIDHFCNCIYDPSNDNYDHLTGTNEIKNHS